MKRRLKKWQSQILPLDFQNDLVPAIHARPYVFGPPQLYPIRTPQPDLWKSAPAKSKRKRLIRGRRGG